MPRTYRPDQPRVFVYETADLCKVVHPVGEPPMLIVDPKVWESQSAQVQDNVLEGRMTFLQFMRRLDV